MRSVKTRVLPGLAGRADTRIDNRVTNGVRTDVRWDWLAYDVAVFEVRADTIQGVQDASM